MGLNSIGLQPVAIGFIRVSPFHRRFFLELALIYTWCSLLLVDHDVPQCSTRAFRGNSWNSKKTQADCLVQSSAYWKRVFSWNFIEPSETLLAFMPQGCQLGFESIWLDVFPFRFPSTQRRMGPETSDIMLFLPMPIFFLRVVISNHHRTFQHKTKNFNKCQGDPSLTTVFGQSPQWLAKFCHKCWHQRSTGLDVGVVRCLCCRDIIVGGHPECDTEIRSCWTPLLNSKNHNMLKFKLKTFAWQHSWWWERTNGFW